MIKTKALKEKVSKHLTTDGRRATKLEKEKKKNEKEIRRQYATAAAFSNPESAATSPTPEQPNQPWYGPQGGISSEEIEPLGVNLSEPFGNKHLAPLTTFSGTQLLENQEYKSGSASLASTQIDSVQPSQSKLSSIMGRGRFDTRTMPMETGDDVVFREKMARGTLPVEPSNPNIRDKDNLRAHYSMSEETFIASKTTNPQQLVRRPVAAESPRTGKRSQAASPFREPPLDDTAPILGNFYSSVPPDSSTKEPLNFGTRRSSEVFNDDSIESSDQVQDYEDGKASYNSNRKVDEMKRLEKEISEESSSDQDFSRKDVKAVRAQLKKAVRRVKELELEKEKISGRLETTEFMYQKQLQQKQAENATEKKEYEKKVQEILGKHVTEEAEMQSDYEKNLFKAEKSYEKKLTKLELDLERVKTDLQSEKDSREREIRLLKDKHENNVQQATEPLQNEIYSLKEKLERYEKERADEIQNLMDGHEEALRIEKENSSKLLRGMSSDLARVKEEKATEIKDLIEQHNFDMDEVRGSLQEQIQTLQANFRQLTLTKDEEIERNREAHEAEKSRMREEHEADREAHEAEKSRMRKEHEIDKMNSLRQLKEDLEVFKGLLFKRDNFKAMTDNDLEDGFGAIRHEVDEIARVEWNKLYEFKWPFNEQSLHLSKIKRVAKQHLIQNTLWVILYEKIFCTPFRVLGSEGRALEAKWIREFGQDDHSSGVPCPRASKESEKWRYEKIVKCIEAIKQAPTNSEHIKEGYESTLKDVTNHLFYELERVADASDMERQGIDKPRVSELVRTAAKLWLEIGQQRFRTKLVMSESGERPVQSNQNALSHSGTLNIVIFPELRRLGNAQGEQLDHEEMVMGCKGFFTVFRTR